MQQVIVPQEQAGFTWVDVWDPTPAELAQVALDFGLHSTSVQDCLQSDHLPKIETIGDIRFMMIRAYDDLAEPTGDTIQKLTRKLAIFYGDQFIVTIHRAEQNYIKAVRDKWFSKTAESHSRLHIINDLLRGAATSFEQPTYELENRISDLEAHIFHGADKKTLEHGYYLRRRAAALKQTLRMLLEVLSSLHDLPIASRPFFQDLREMLTHLGFHAAEALDNVNILLNLHISLASQRTNEASQKTNEVMRLLTVFSVFFLPLNFIAGIYGMNFEFMPELKWHAGYPLVLTAMLLVAVSILLYFKRKGWLTRPNL